MCVYVSGSENEREKIVLKLGEGERARRIQADSIANRA